jgi:hypothetical protein
LQPIGQEIILDFPLPFMHVTMKIYDQKIVAPRIGDIWIHASQFLIDHFIRFFSFLSIKLFSIDVKGHTKT